MTTTFDGQAVIKVRFRNNPEYVKFREQILKTKWNPGDVYPTWEEMKIDFHNVDDLDKVTRTVVMLLQNGFEVYSTRYKLEQQLAEEEHPTEGDTDGDVDIISEDMIEYASSAFNDPIAKAFGLAKNFL